MRITCPNCAAQYEVDDALIPEGGRDVQCSNCGKGWFQPGRAAVAVDVAAEMAPDEDTTVTSEETARETIEEPPPVAEGHSAPEEIASEHPTAEDDTRTDDDDADDEARPAMAEAAPPAPTEDEDEQDDAPAQQPAAAAPRGTDESILSVLREEAEREIAQRRREAEALESQPDLGLAETAAGGGTQAPPPEAAGVGAAGRRDLLPDIDAINSSLRSDADRSVTQDDGEDLVEERRRGFRLGFGIVLLVTAALIAVYVGAASIAQAIPALEPVLVAYVDLANGFRAWIDGLLAAGVDGLSSLVPPVTDA